MKVQLFFRNAQGGFRSLEEVFDIVIHALENVEVKVLDEAVASDHRAIFAVLEFQPDSDSARQ